MKRIIIFVIIMIGLLSSFIIAENTPDKIEIIEGKNTINTSKEVSPIYVEQLVKEYPQIEAISYSVNNETIGFVNAFQGIGENFIVYPEKEYEIISKQNFTLYLK
jgi:hypothetical protein